MVGIAASPCRGRGGGTCRARRHLPGTLSALWLISGQGTRNIDDFIRSSTEIVSGYSQAMGIEASPDRLGRRLRRRVTAVILAAGVVVDARPAARRGASRWSRSSSSTAFIAAKQAFVRHDGGHAGVFAGPRALASLLAMRRSPGGRLVVVAGCW